MSYFRVIHSMQLDENGPGWREMEREAVKSKLRQLRAEHGDKVKVFEYRDSDGKRFDFGIEEE